MNQNVALSLDEKKEAAGKSAVWYMAASFTTKAVGFITIPIFARIMSFEEYGLFNNYVAWQAIFLCILGLESYLTVNRARFDYDEKRLQEYQFTLLTTGTALSAVFLILIELLPNIAIGITDLDIQYLIILALYVMFYPAFAMFQSLQRIQYRYKLSAGLSFFTSLLSTILSVFLVVVLSDALMGRIVGQYVPFIVLGIGAYLWYGKTGRKISLSYLKCALPTCVPLVISALGGYILLVGSRIIAQHMCSSEEMAYVSLAVTCAQVAYVLITTLNNAWSPWLMDCLHENRNDAVKETFLPFAWCVLLVTVICSFASPELVTLLGGEQYRLAAPLLPAFMCAMFLNMIASQYVFVETYHKNVKMAGIIAFFVSLLHLGLCTLSIWFFSVYALGYASCISYVLLIVGHKAVMKRFHYPDLFDIWVMGIPMLISVVSVFTCIPLIEGDFLTLRYLVIGICCIACIAVLKKAMRMFSKGERR